MTKLMPPAWREANRFIDALTCEPGAYVTVQIFADTGDQVRAEHRNVRLSDRRNSRMAHCGH